MNRPRILQEHPVFARWVPLFIASEDLSTPTAFSQEPASRKTMPEDIEEKVAEQNVYEKSLPDEAAEK